MDTIEFQNQRFDKKHSTIYQSDNDWEELILLVAENAKEGKTEPSVFEVFAKDFFLRKEEWISDFLKSTVSARMKLFPDEEKGKNQMQWNNHSFIQHISDWALQLFNNHYRQNEMASPVCYAGSRELREEFLVDVPPANTITKQDIFYYVYAVLHYPAYREKYEANLKRGFPRIPLYDNFYKWATWGNRLIDIYTNLERVTPLVFDRKEVNNKKESKIKLCALKEEGIIQVDGNTELHGIPQEAWQYKLDKQSALEWILCQYKRKKRTDRVIAHHSATCCFADYKDQLIILLQKVCTISLETMKIVNEMKNT